MSSMKGLQQINSNYQSKYNEIIEYLKQDNGYWLNNDKWDLTKDFFIGKRIRINRYFNFERINNNYLKNEIKYYFLFNFKNCLIKLNTLDRQSESLKNLSYFSNKYLKVNTLNQANRNKTQSKWILFLNEIDVKTTNVHMKNITNFIIDFIKDFYDDREETEKDIWYSKNVKGAKIPASGANHYNNNQINFSKIPIYYRGTVKRYFKTIITKKSWNHCFQILSHLNYFFDKFYLNGYTDEFIENLSRQDIENYLYWLNNDHKSKNATYKSKFISYVRTF